MKTQRILGLDPGAVRLGWAFVDTGDPLKLFGSGYLETQKYEGEKHSDYLDRLLLGSYAWWMEFFSHPHCLPNAIYCERLPVVLKSIQGTSARIAISATRLAAHHCEIPWNEIAASTVKKELTGVGEASKVRVRNAVIEVFPELKPRKYEIIADESDAIGIGIIGARKYAGAA